MASTMKAWRRCSLFAKAVMCPVCVSTMGPSGCKSLLGMGMRGMMWPGRGAAFAGRTAAPAWATGGGVEGDSDLLSSSPYTLL